APGRRRRARMRRADPTKPRRPGCGGKRGGGALEAGDRGASRDDAVIGGARIQVTNVMSRGFVIVLITAILSPPPPSWASQSMEPNAPYFGLNLIPVGFPEHFGGRLGEVFSVRVMAGGRGTADCIGDVRIHVPQG